MHGFKESCVFTMEFTQGAVGLLKFIRENKKGIWIAGSTLTLPGNPESCQDMLGWASIRILL